MSFANTAVDSTHEPDGWRRLWEEAQRETNPTRLDAIIKRMNLLLTEHEQQPGAGEAGHRESDVQPAHAASLR
jgi:hypothetical protein